MNIKSLLLGSAAALVAVSGARAADAIMAVEPEPVEYVRVCDAFGTGFFYIPGTETCLRISGYVRYDKSWGELLGLDTDGDGEGDTWKPRARFSFRTDTRTETELGTLRAYTEVRVQYDIDGELIAGQGHTETSLNFAYIELGGFRVGKTESEFTRWTGYAGGVINDTINLGYGPFDVTQISYTYEGGNGFSAVLALESDENYADDFRSFLDDDEDYIPDVVAGLAYEAGAFKAAIVGGYDESVGEGAIKGRLDATFGRVQAFLMAAWSSNGGEFSITGPSNRFAQWGGDWAVWGGATIGLTERIDFNSQVGYDDAENFHAVGNLAFEVVPGFDFITEVAYGENFDIDDSDAIGGTIRFQRSF